MSSDKKHIGAGEDVTNVETNNIDTKNVETKNLDQAALFLAEAEGVEPLTAKQGQRLKRKIDFILIPMVRFALAETKTVLTTIALHHGHARCRRQSRTIHGSPLPSSRGQRSCRSAIFVAWFHTISRRPSRHVPLVCPHPQVSSCQIYMLLLGHVVDDGTFDASMQQLWRTHDPALLDGRS